MQLERKRKQFEERGVQIAAISYDSVEVLKTFADRAGVGFPLLSDPDSAIIRAFGVLNEEVPDDHPFFGIPHPVELLLGPDGVVKERFHEESYRDRFTAGRVLVRQLGSEAAAAKATARTAHLKVTSWASDAVVRGGNRFALVLDVALNPKMHVYSPEVTGYIPIEWRMDEADGLTHFEAEFPESRILHLPAIDESVPVYEGDFRLVRDVMIGQAAALKGLLSDGTLTIRGSLRYQACDDRMCYLPSTVPLEWTVDFEQHDRTRVPEALRRQGD